MDRTTKRNRLTRPFILIYLWASQNWFLVRCILVVTLAYYFHTKDYHA